MFDLICTIENTPLSANSLDRFSKLSVGELIYLLAYTEIHKDSTFHRIHVQ